ncbi:MAG TPA: ABC transporter ATP-binding protein [Opitutaceae bacterium]|nr:ABC transporter ATP-binding protein [Opitutaceae bacterium]
MSKAVITVENLGKRYTLNHQPASGLFREQLSHTLRAPLRWLRRDGKAPHSEREEFWALRDINFSIGRGEVVGIIGRNGAGKSTLLKILSRITEPSRGRVSIRGRVASLLEVGTGFHPELSGRENIFLNGAILGMTRAEIRRKFDEIVAFAEVERFLDTPVKHYSSGMYVRLAFAVAAHLEPEILVIDEVLAVGDMQFQKKCLGKMQSVAATEGRTVLFVSHNTSAVQNLCTRTLLLTRGQLTFDGGVREGLQRYLDAGAAKTGRALDHQSEVFAGGPLRCTALTVNGRAEDQLAVPDTRTPLAVEMLLEVSTSCRVSLESFLCDRYGNKLAFASPGHDESNAHVHQLAPGRHRLRAQLVLPQLVRGHYQLEFVLVEPFVRRFIVFPAAVELAVDGSGTTWGRLFEEAPTPLGYQILAGTVSIEPAP